MGLAKAERGGRKMEDGTFTDITVEEQQRSRIVAEFQQNRSRISTEPQQNYSRIIREKQ
jgi:hypothetical protein